MIDSYNSMLIGPLTQPVNKLLFVSFQPEISLIKMDSVGKVKAIKESVAQKDHSKLKKLIVEDLYDDENNYWELLSLFGECLTRENFDNYNEFFESCESCMVYILDQGNPKELLLALLEQADTFTEHIRFQTFLQLIQRTILRLPSKQLYSLELALETLAECFRNLELPKNADLEELETRAYELDPRVDKITQTVLGFLDFMGPFIEQVSCDKKDQFEGEDLEKHIAALMKYLLQVLNHSLIYLNLTYDSKAERPVKSYSRVCAEKLMSLVNKICPNIHNLIEAYKARNKAFEKRVKTGGEILDEDLFGEGLVSELALASLAYLVHAEGLGIMGYPSLYSHQGVLELNMPFILLLEKQTEVETRRKGILLLQCLISYIDPLYLTYYDLDRPEYFKILDYMFDIMVHCADRELRQLCVKLLPRFIQMFKLEARYQIFEKIFSTLKHSGAFGYCVQLLKNQIEEILTITPMSNTFTGLKLKKLFLLMTSLKDGPATDLLENSDRIISVLNLMRYLVLKDTPSSDKMGFWKFYGDIERDFIKPLFLGLDMSQGHYAQELKGLEQGRTAKNKDEKVEMSVTVTGFKMPKMERSKKMEVFRQALNTFDIIRSLVVRVEELAEQQKKIAKV